MSAPFDVAVWLLPIAVLAAGLWRPHLGLVAFAVGLPFFGSPPGGPYLAALDAGALAAIATAWRAGPPARGGLALPAGAFLTASLASLVPASWGPPDWSPGVLAGLVASFPSIERWTTLFTWRAAADLILGWALFVAARRAFAGRSPRELGAALGWGTLAVVAAGYLDYLGLVDLWGWRPIGLPVFDQRFHGLFFHSGWLALFLVVAAPFAIAALAVGGRRDRVAATALAILAPTAIVLSQQRGAWFALLGQLGVLALVASARLGFGRRFVGRAVAALAASVLLLAMVVAARPAARGALGDRLEEAAGNLSKRSGVWAVTAEAAAKRPLLGWGLGSFSPVYDATFPGGAHRSSWLTAHNHYLMLVAERGLLGLTSFLLLAGVAVAAVWRRVRGPDGEGRQLAAGLLVGLAGAAPYAGVQYLFFLRNTEWTCWLLLAAVACLAPPRRERWLERSAAAIAVASLLMVPVRLLAVEPGPRRGDREYGFHAVERHPEAGAFQWTEGRAVRRLERRGDVLVLRLANGHPLEAARPISVSVRVDGVERLADELTRGWSEHRIVLGPEAGDEIVLEIRAWPAFRPYRDFLRSPALERSREIRELGVAFAEPRWEGGAGDSPP